MVKEEALVRRDDLIEPVYSPQMLTRAMTALLADLKKKDAEVAMLYRELRQKNDFDELTGIYNRQTFYQKTEALFTEYPEDDFIILRLDVERFKLVNDLFGEEAGDRLLVAIAAKLEESRLTKCVYGRLHADNFVLCFSVQRNDPLEFIQNMQESMEHALRSYKVVMAFGLYYVKDTSLAVSTMCDRAGLAKQQIKGNYMKSYSEYDEKMRNAILQEQDIVNEMKVALEEGQFELYLQPKYQIIDEKITGAEALARWLHPKKGMISPAVFIPAFERNGFIMELDVYIWDKTCQLLRKWIDEGKKPCPISVNVSRLDLYRTDLCDILSNMVKKYDLDPALLQLELTETAYTDNPQQIISITKKLQSLGFSILMDDFGSGYSALNMLKDVSVDVLKIDLHFLDNQDDPGRSGNILNSVVRMADWLDIPVIAEGVETRQQADFMRDIGCYHVQGYYYSRPLPVNDFETLFHGLE